MSLTGSVKMGKLDEKHVNSILFQAAGGNGIVGIVELSYAKLPFIALDTCIYSA